MIGEHERQSLPVADQDLVVVGDLETLRVLSHPLRLRMVELMSRGEWTVKQVAAALDVGQTRLYHHVALLESHGLLRTTGTRMVSGITEKRYQAPARLSVESALFAGGSQDPEDVARGVDGLVAAAFTKVRREIGQAIQAGRIEVSPDGRERRGITLTLDDARLTEARATEFRERLEALMMEFSDASQPLDAATPPSDSGEYRLLVGFFRTADRTDRADGADRTTEPVPGR